MLSLDIKRARSGHTHRLSRVTAAVPISYDRVAQTARFCAYADRKCNTRNYGPDGDLYTARRSPIRGKTGELVSASMGRIGRPN